MFSVRDEIEGVRFFAPRFEEGGMSGSAGRFAAAARAAGTRGAVTENLAGNSSDRRGGSGTGSNSKWQAV